MKTSTHSHAKYEVIGREEEGHVTDGLIYVRAEHYEFL